MPKQLLTTPQLISHLKRKGITFKYISEDEAADFLDNHNYFLKLYAYRANYQKNPTFRNFRTVQWQLFPKLQKLLFQYLHYIMNAFISKRKISLFHG